MINIVGIFQKSFVQDCILFLTNKLQLYLSTLILKYQVKKRDWLVVMNKSLKIIVLLKKVYFF